MWGGVPLRVNPNHRLGELAAATQPMEGGVDPFALITALVRILGCLGHLAMALSYAGVLGPWAKAAASMALSLAEALDRLPAGGP
jgi:hypothetical protein